MDTPDKISPPTALEPVKVAVISGTGDGSPLVTGTVAVTPDHMPNVIVKMVSPLLAIAIRFVNLFLLTLMGFMTVQIAPTGDSQVMQAIAALDFYHLVLTSAGFSLGPAVLGLVKDLITVFTGLEKKYPLSTGAV